MNQVRVKPWCYALIHQNSHPLPPCALPYNNGALSCTTKTVAGLAVSVCRSVANATPCLIGVRKPNQTCMSWRFLTSLSAYCREISRQTEARSRDFALLTFLWLYGFFAILHSTIENISYLKSIAQSLWMHSKGQMTLSGWGPRNKLTH